MRYFFDRQSMMFFFVEPLLISLLQFIFNLLFHSLAFWTLGLLVAVLHLSRFAVSFNGSIRPLYIDYFDDDSFLFLEGIEIDEFLIRVEVLMRKSLQYSIE